MPDYPDAANPDVLGRIPLTARTVLDVGCASGALGAAYRRLNPRARILGIELDPKAAASAAERLDAVANVDVEADPLPFEDLTDLDCIVYGDVLEHLREPWAVVRSHVAALSDQGTIVICVPNVEHWVFVDRLLRGTWAYEEFGLLDATHLRWFTLENIRRGLLACGLSLCDVQPRIFDVPKVEAFVAAITPALQTLGVDPANYATRAAPLQYVWRARKTQVQPMMIGANMLNPVGGVSHLRVMYPLSAIATDPAVVARIAAPSSLSVPDPEHPHIYILHRPILTGERGLSAIRNLLQDGWLIVTEFDDHPDFFQSQMGPDQFVFAGVHAIQTSTPAMAEILRERNPEIRVFPNAIRALPPVRNFADPETMTVFFGALNRERDWQPLMPSINAIASRVGERLKFCVVHDQGFFEALQTPHKTFTPTCDYDTYMNLLGGCEISLMPLGDTPFNRAKSDLKFIEAGACRVAALASNVVYADSIEDGRTGLLFGDPDEMHERLLRLIAMPDLARAIGDAARDYVTRERMLAHQVADRVAWYRDLWDRREELTAALLARLVAMRTKTEAAPHETVETDAVA
jgi:SAM-dependent methyltransferase/glycosyltransferase involved in cell wall biosynthesis